MSKENFHDWLEFSEHSNKSNILDRLADGFHHFKAKNLFFSPKTNLQLDDACGEIWYPSIAENPAYGIVRSTDHKFAWLARAENDKLIRELNPPVYEEEPTKTGGYKDYAAQETWRLEKSRRQVKELLNITNLPYSPTTCILDVGSGYGYFRKALDEANLTHYGIEVSHFANSLSKKMYGFDTYTGVLSDHLDKFTNKCDAVVLTDVIEHIANPEDLLKDIYSTLKPNGFAVIKTPNINCPEVKVFVRYYHSFKREHLTYFTVESLISYAAKAGFNCHQALSISHLLVGFVGKEQTDEWAQSLQGSDLVIYLRK